MDNELETLRSRLLAHIGAHDLTIADIAKRVDRTPLTIWNFLRKNTTPHFALKNRIERLVNGEKLRKRAK